MTAEIMPMEILVRSRLHHPPELYINGVCVESQISSKRYRLVVEASADSPPTIKEETVLNPFGKLDV